MLEREKLVHFIMNEQHFMSLYMNLTLEFKLVIIMLKQGMTIYPSLIKYFNFHYKSLKY